MAKVLAAAEMTGVADEQRLREALNDQDAGIRFWAVMALQAQEEITRRALSGLTALLDDPSPTVQVAAAETLCHRNQCTAALPVLERWVQDDRPWLALYAARSIELLAAKAKPLVPILYKVLEKNAAPEGSSKRYQDNNFAAFTSWSLEWALQHCGEEFNAAEGDLF